MAKIISYTHHGVKVFVREDLQGQHQQHCLCFSCQKLHPCSPDNCLIAQATFENCVKFHITTPVWECPEFEGESK